jgi:hypothetical protein
VPKHADSRQPTTLLKVSNNQRSCALGVPETTEDGVVLYGCFSKADLYSFHIRNHGMRMIYSSWNFSWSGIHFLICLGGIMEKRTPCQQDILASRPFTVEELRMKSYLHWACVSWIGPMYVPLFIDNMIELWIDSLINLLVSDSEKHM